MRCPPSSSRSFSQSSQTPRLAISLVTDGVIDEGLVHDALTTSPPLEDGQFDMVFTSGILIHVAPDDLDQACPEIYRVSKKYVFCIEYFSTSPESVNYYGNAGFLFKCDFGGRYLDLFPNIRLVDYGFFWRRATGIDDMTMVAFREMNGISQVLAGASRET